MNSRSQNEAHGEAHDGGGRTEAVNMLAGVEGEDAVEVEARERRSAAATELLKHLAPIERDMLLRVQSEQSLEAVAGLYETTRERVRQILSQAAMKMRMVA